MSSLYSFKHLLFFLFFFPIPVVSFLHILPLIFHPFHNSTSPSYSYSLISSFHVSPLLSVSLFLQSSLLFVTSPIPSYESFICIIQVFALSLSILFFSYIFPFPFFLPTLYVLSLPHSLPWSPSVSLIFPSVSCSINAGT